MAEEEEADGYMYRNHILPHWLDYIKSLSKGSPVIIVQNKIDAHRTKPAPNQKAIEVEYDVRYFHHVSAKNGRGINDLKEIIKEAIQEMPEWNLELPGSWHEPFPASPEAVRPHRAVCYLLHSLSAPATC